MQSNNSFKVELETKAKAKNGVSNVVIETSLKGLIYRTEAYLDDHLIDAIEVNCSDISTIDKNEEIFYARYLASHTKFEEKYTLEKIFTKVMTSEGDYVDDEGSISIITSISDKTYKVEVFLDSIQVDSERHELLNADDKVFKAKYTQTHKNYVQKYILVPRFPANTFINPVIKKFPMYKKSPMSAFMFFLATVILVLWILSLIVCGKALKKIVVSVAGKEAGMVVKDLQKSMCKKAKGEVDANGNLVDEDGNKLDKDGNALSKVDLSFVMLPQKINFVNANQIYPVYIKNTMPNDALVILKDRMIFNFQNALVDPNMVIRVINKTDAVHIKSGEVGLFEFKLEDSFLQSEGLEEISYHGSIVLEANNLQTREVLPLNISFEFSVEKKINEIEETVDEKLEAIEEVTE